MNQIGSMPHLARTIRVCLQPRTSTTPTVCFGVDTAWEARTGLNREMRDYVAHRGMSRYMAMRSKTLSIHIAQ